MKSIYRDPRWSLLQQEKEGGKAVTFEYSSKAGKIIYRFIKRHAGIVDEIEYFDIATPRGLGGPYIEDCVVEERELLIRGFDSAFSVFCNEQSIIAEYVRFDPWVDNSIDFCDIYSLHPYGLEYCNDLTLDFFQHEYKYSKRTDIRKAIKNGIVVEFDEIHESLNEFLNMYSFTADKYGVSDYYSLNYDFINKYCLFMPDETVFANAKYKGMIISSAVILFGEDIAHYHFAANDPEYSSLQGNSLLIYEASLYAAEKGKKLMDLGSAAVGSKLERFKQSFIYGGRKYTNIVGTKIRSQIMYDKLVEQAGGNHHSGDYFPAYRR